MKAWPVIVLSFALVWGVPASLVAQNADPKEAAPKYDVAAESTTKGLVEEVKDRNCAHGAADGAVPILHFLDQAFCSALGGDVILGGRLFWIGVLRHQAGGDTPNQREAQYDHWPGFHGDFSFPSGLAVPWLLDEL